ncbi:MAG: phage major capsid protein [Clostridiales bacterium]|nr:phage major capsid protein [Clostridiales bacterium]
MNEIEKMTIEEVEARTLEIESEVESADEERLTSLKSELDKLEERKTELKKAAEVAQEERNAIAEGTAPIEETKEVITEERTMTNAEVVKSVEYRNAFKKYIITGKDEECRALLTENVGTGVVPVPEIVYDIVKNAWEKEGIMALVKKTYLKGNLKVGFEISADGAVIHTEGAAAPTEEKLIIGVVELVPMSIKKWITISDEVVDMDSGAFIQYVYDELTYQIAKKAADTLIAKIEACGTVSTNTPSINVGVPVVEADSIALDTIAQAIAQLSDQATNPVIVMNKTTFAAFKAVQAAGSYGYDPFEGLSVVFNNSIKGFGAASSGDTYAIVGDFAEGAIANFPNGEDITIKYDDLSLAEKDLVKLVGRQFVGLEVVAPNAFVKIAKSAT